MLFILCTQYLYLRCTKVVYGLGVRYVVSVLVSSSLENESEALHQAPQLLPMQLLALWCRDLSRDAGFDQTSIPASQRNPLRWWNIFCWRGRCKQSIRRTFSSGGVNPCISQILDFFSGKYMFAGFGSANPDCRVLSFGASDLQQTDVLFWINFISFYQWEHTFAPKATPGRVWLKSWIEPNSLHFTSNKARSEARN